MFGLFYMWVEQVMGSSGCQLLFPAIFGERYIIYNTNSAKLSVIIYRRGENR